MEVLRGSCVCGAVTYEANAPFLRFAHCHCSRCRKATGSSHATNLYVVFDQFKWLSGQESVARYDLPAARSFANTFCRTCGSPLPHHTRSKKEVVVPAGSLDTQPSLEPQADIFWDSRASWGCRGSEKPKFQEYPPWW